MNRRQLFAAAGALGVDKLVPKLPALEPITTNWEGEADGNTLLSVDMILRETLRLFRQQSAFINGLNAQYNAGFAERRDTLRIRVPST